MATSILPPTGILSAAYNELAANAKGAQLRALNKAALHLASGVTPLQTLHDAWLVPSGTRAGTVWRVTNEGCHCEAAQAGKPCWHREAVSIIVAASALRLEKPTVRIAAVLSPISEPAQPAQQPEPKAPRQPSEAYRKALADVLELF